MKAPLLALALGLGAARLEAAPALLHQPPTRGEMGAPLPIEVTLEGAVADEARATLHYRPRGASQFTSVALAWEGEGRYAGAIPAAATGALSVVYHLEVEGPQGSYRLRVGSAAAPVAVTLLEAASPAAASPLALVAAAGLALSLPALVVQSVRRQRRRRELDRRFWEKIFNPLGRLRGDDLVHAVRRLSELDLNHPVSGPTRFSRQQIVGRLVAYKERTAHTPSQDIPPRPQVTTAGAAPRLMAVRGARANAAGIAEGQTQPLRLAGDRP